MIHDVYIPITHTTCKILNSPETIKCPLGSDTPLKPFLLDGKLAALCQEVPPSFFRISVEPIPKVLVKILVNPPDTR